PVYELPSPQVAIVLPVFVTAISPESPYGSRNPFAVMYGAAPAAASEIFTGADHVTPPSVEVRYHTFQASKFPPFVCMYQARTSVALAISTDGKSPLSPAVESATGADHVAPPSVECFA